MANPAKTYGGDFEQKRWTTKHGCQRQRLDTGRSLDRASPIPAAAFSLLVMVQRRAANLHVIHIHKHMREVQ